MPYIKTEKRIKLQPIVNKFTEDLTDPGELNYLITKLALTYLHQHGESYQTFNDIIGVLEASKLELFRRKVALYEDGKIFENGDVGR